jgi:predicted dehydrogenase
MKIGLVGYGVGGQFFHAPYIDAAEGAELAGIVVRSPDKRAIAAGNFPGVPLFDSLSALIDSGVDAVTITTPPDTRQSLVLEALGRGIHVIADKPFAVDAARGAELVQAASDAGVALDVFHNRRWDTDIQTLKAVIDSGSVGEVARFESRFDLDQPHLLEAGPAGGLLRDLGSHLIDQAVWLFGPAATVYANLDYIDLPAGRTDCGFLVTIKHVSGVVSLVSSTKTRKFTHRELRILGTEGSYISEQSDVQASAIFSGQLPKGNQDTWGFEAEERWGTLHTAAGTSRVPSKQGNYTHYYEQFVRAIEGRDEHPVTGADALQTLQILDAARLSDSEERVVRL